MISLKAFYSFMANLKVSLHVPIAQAAMVYSGLSDLTLAIDEHCYTESSSVHTCAALHNVTQLCCCNANRRIRHSSLKLTVMPVGSGSTCQISLPSELKATKTCLILRKETPKIMGFICVYSMS